MVYIFAAKRGNCTEKEASRLLMEMAYEQVFSAALPPIEHTPYGKPYFKGRPDVHVSLSHSKDYIACAFSSTRIGIDIEKVRPVKKGIAQRVCAASERSSFTFFSAWVLKESFIKWQGRYTSHFRTLVFTGNDASARTTPSHVRARVYHDIEGYRVGVCVSHQAPPAQVRVLDISQQKEAGAVTILPEHAPYAAAVRA